MAARPARKPAAGATAREDVYALVGAQLSGGAGCTCGAADQLEEERSRLASYCDGFTGREEQILLREAELDERVRTIDESTQGTLRGERELEERRSGAENELVELDGVLHDALERDGEVQRGDEEMQRQSEELLRLDAEAKAREDAICAEESALIEERNLAEEKLFNLRRERQVSEARLSELERQREGLLRRFDDVQREQNLLASDEQLLTEIEEQMKPIPLNLADREQRLDAEERELCAREADCAEREARALPECHRNVEALSAAEDRARELERVEAESQRQHLDLLQRQRDLGGTQIRLSGLEGALRLHQGIAGEGKAELPCDVDEIEERRARLRHADTDWVERVRKQQAEVHRLEQRAEALEAEVQARHGSRGSHLLTKKHAAPKRDKC